MAAPSPGSAEAAELIWKWREEAVAPTSRSYSRERRRGALQAAAGAVVGGLLLWGGWTKPGSIVLGIAGLILLSSQLSPGGLYAMIERFTGAIARRLGTALTWLLMVPLFYVFFLPFGLLFRRGKRDRLKRFYERESPSYWELREGPTTASSSHESQY